MTLTIRQKQALKLINIEVHKLRSGGPINLLNQFFINGMEDTILFGTELEKSDLILLYKKWRLDKLNRDKIVAENTIGTINDELAIDKVTSEI